VNRLSVGGKSPLTGGIKESNSGGTFGLRLARLGIKALIIEGGYYEDGFKIIKVNKNGADIVDAEKYVGLKTVEAADALRRDWGDNWSIAVIGPAGEMRLFAASIVVTDKEGVASRHLGRGGLGAVMGSKGIKAIMLDDTGCESVKAENPQLLKDSIKQYTHALLNTPQTSHIYTNYGTTAMVDTTNALGGMPTRCFSQGSFEHAEKINGVALRNRILERKGDPSHACMPGCVIRSSNIYCGEDGKEIVRSLEYETIVLCGSNLGIADLDAIAEINAKINNLGLDSIDTGGAIGVAMDVGILQFGDIDGVMALLEDIEKNTPLGRLIGCGAAITGQVLGAKRIPAAKGQGFPGYDPRAIKGHGVTYSTSPMGADHTAGMNIREGLDQHSKEGQVESSLKVQQYAAIYDSLGICLFAHVAVRDKLDVIVNMLNGVYGNQWNKECLMDMANNTLRLEVEYNRKAGLDKSTDRIPEVFYKEKLPPADLLFDIEADELKKVFEGI